MDSLDSFSAQDSAGARGDDLANSLLNFTAGPDDFDLQSAKRQKSARDPMSHRIIEKRRRDRMNNCLADLSRLIPTSYLKQGQGRIEKTEIIEMAIKHIKTLQAQVESAQNATYNMAPVKRDTGTSTDGGLMSGCGCCGEQFYAGFKECRDEALHYLVEGEAMVTSDPFYVRIMDNLTKAAQRYNHLAAREDTKDSLMEMESQQQPMSGTRPFSAVSRFSTTQPHLPYPLSLPSLDPMLPRFPSSTCTSQPHRLLSSSASSSVSSLSVVTTSSSVSNKQLRNLLSARALQNMEADRDAAAHHHQHALDLKGVMEGSSAPPPSLLTCTVTSMNTDSPLPSVLGGGGGCGGDSNSTCQGGGATSSSGYVSDTLDRFCGGSGMGVGGGGEGKDCSGVGSAGGGGARAGGGAMNVYKFKHNITKRFSQEGKTAAASSRLCHNYDRPTSSRDAKDDLSPHSSSHHHHNHHNHHHHHHHHLTPSSSKHRSSLKSKSKPYMSSSDSGPYPMSDLSASSLDGMEGGSPSSDRSRNRREGGGGKERPASGGSDFGSAGADCPPAGPPSASVPLPGFVLHPSGTHYMPMSVSYSKLPEIFDSVGGGGGDSRGVVGPPVFHPISIPVHFQGPVVSVPESGLFSQGYGKIADVPPPSKDVKGIKKL